MFPSKEILRITVSRTTDGAADDGEIVTVGHSGGGRAAAAIAIAIAANLELPASMPRFPPPPS